MNMHSARAAFGLDKLKTILGIPVVAIRWNDAIVLLNRLIAERRFTKVSFLNAHNANIACTDPVFAEALDDFLILPDGIGVDLAARLLYGAPFPDNLNGTDFVPAFLQASTKRRRSSWQHWPCSTGSW
jgi:UDP-N-acetyl-D-mannosaminuronic acid transferase (WecB/TagA/CpsF family)